MKGSRIPNYCLGTSDCPFRWTNGLCCCDSGDGVLCPMACGMWHTGAMLIGDTIQLEEE